eukprot:6005146-Amphidinium_carterae.1
MVAGLKQLYWEQLPAALPSQSVRLCMQFSNCYTVFRLEEESSILDTCYNIRTYVDRSVISQGCSQQFATKANSKQLPVSVRI